MCATTAVWLSFCVFNGDFFCIDMIEARTTMLNGIGHKDSDLMLAVSMVAAQILEDASLEHMDRTSS